MAKKKELFNRIQAINSIQQVTQAMRMVSVAKLEKNKKNYREVEAYSLSLQKLYQEIGTTPNSLYTQKRKVNTILTIVITSDRGLCGSFNNVLISKMKQAHKQAIQAKKQITFLPIGKKAKEFLRKKEWSLVEEYAELPESNSLVFATKLSKFLVDSFFQGTYDEIQLIYQKDNQATPESTVLEKLLPLPSVTEEQQAQDTLLLYEPNKTTLVEHILAKVMLVELYKKILIAKIAEHKTRMLAMSQASDNATDLSHELTLKYNRIRQASITRELIDITGGVEALK